MAGEAEGVAPDSGVGVTDAEAAEDSDQVGERVEAVVLAIVMVPREEVASVGAHVGAVVSDRVDPQIAMVVVQTDIRQAAVGHAAISEARVVEEVGPDIVQALGDLMTVQEAPKLAADSKLKDFLSSFSPISF